MAKKLILLFNHTLTPFQVEAAVSSLGVEEIVDLPPEHKALWRQIPPELTEIEDYLNPIIHWLRESANEGDYVLIQGDFGACFILIRYSFEEGFIPIYSTTLRDVVENHQSDGSVRVVHRFQHQAFRRYGA